MPRARIAVAGALALVVAAVVAILALGGGSSPPSRPAASRGVVPRAPATIDGTAFTAAMPAGWVLVEERKGSRGGHGFHLSSTGRAVSGLGIAPAGTAAITITESAPGALAALKAGGRSLSGASPVEILRHVVGQPAEAVAVVTAQAPKATQLAGAPAAEAAWGYGFEGRGIMQVDLATDHGGRLFTVELDAEPGLAGPSQAALDQLVSSWRWR